MPPFPRGSVVEQAVWTVFVVDQRSLRIERNHLNSVTHQEMIFIDAYENCLKCLIYPWTGLQTAAGFDSGVLQLLSPFPTENIYVRLK